MNFENDDDDNIVVTQQINMDNREEKSCEILDINTYEILTDPVGKEIEREQIGYQCKGIFTTNIMCKNEGKAFSINTTLALLVEYYCCFKKPKACFGFFETTMVP